MMNGGGENLRKQVWNDPVSKDEELWFFFLNTFQLFSGYLLMGAGKNTTKQLYNIHIAW